MSPRPKLLLSIATLMVLATLSDVSFAQKGGGNSPLPPDHAQATSNAHCLR